MRGNEAPQANLFSYVYLEDRIPRRHPLRPVRRMVDQALAGMGGAFAAMYVVTRRPSIPSERLPRALLLQICYSVRSEALLIKQLDYSPLFRWFVGLGIDEPVWDPSTFSKNRDRAQNTTSRRSAIDGRTTRHAGYTISQRIRKRIEEVVGRGKAIGPLRQVPVRGIEKVGFVVTLTATYSLVRLRNLAGAAP